MNDECEHDCGCADRIDALEAELNELTNELREVRRREIRPRLQSVESGLEEQSQTPSDDARRERAELRQDIESLTDRVAGMFGLDDDEETVPKKRQRDLRMALVRRAEANTSANEGTASMYYAEVQDMLASAGHGTVYREQCLRAMEEIAHGDGFELTSKQSQHGNEVKAIGVNIDALPFEPRRNNVTTREDGDASSDGYITRGDST